QALSRFAGSGGRKRSTSRVMNAWETSLAYRFTPQTPMATKRTSRSIRARMSSSWRTMTSSRHQPRVLDGFAPAALAADNPRLVLTGLVAREILDFLEDLEVRLWQGLGADAADLLGQLGEELLEIGRERTHADRIAESEKNRPGLEFPRERGNLSRS